MRLAMMRPYSPRKTDSTVACWSGMQRDGLGDLADGTDFNIAGCAAAGGGDLCGPGESFVEVFAVEDVVAGELFFGFDEGAVSDEEFAVVDADGGGGGA